MKVKAIMAASVAALLSAALYSAPAHAEAAQPTQKPPRPAGLTVTVRPGDSLSKIAKVHRTTYVRLFDANTHIKHPDLIHPGEKLRVPAAGEKLASRPLPGPRQLSAVERTAKAARSATADAKPKVYAKAAAGSGVWDRLAQCESSGNWSINTGNGYSGGLQFTPGTWRGHGGAEFASAAHQASREQQITVAKRVLDTQGWEAWPACTAKLGLR